MKTHRLLAAAVVAGVLTGGPARAAIVKVTVTGVINDLNQDGSNLFGGGSLTNQTVVIRYAFDTSLGAASPVANGDNRTGGTSSNSTSPSLGATITVNGKSVALGGGQFGSIAYTSDASASYHYYEADETDNRYAYSYVTAAAGALPASLTASLTYAVQPTNDASGYFQYDNTFAAFTPVSVTAAVPEPATWALMLTGFLGLGWAGRRAATSRKAAA